MARQKNQGPVHGPYITFRLINRIAKTGVVALDTVDSIPMPADFRICHISWAALGLSGGNATGAILNQSGSVGSGLFDLDANTSGEPKLSDFGATSTGFRNIPKGNALRLAIEGIDAGTVVPAGSVCAWVTGYFKRPISIDSKYAESGQCTMGGPVSGYYDVLTLTNLRTQTGTTGARTECDLLVPYDCRVMAITYHVVGQTGASAILGSVRKNGTSILGATTFNITTNGDVVSGDVGRITAIQGGGFTATGRDFSRGNTLGLWVSTAGAGTDILPIGALSVLVHVWVKGHVDYTSAFPDGQDHPSAVTGPAVGNIVAIPFINKRPAQPTTRDEDSSYPPFNFRTYAAIFSRQVTQVTTRYLSSNAAQGDVTLSSPTQNYILHNEGKNFPSPGSWVGNTLHAGTVPGEDHIGRTFDYGNRLNFPCTLSGSAVFNDTAHLLVTVRSPIGGSAVSGTPLGTAAQYD